MLLSFIGTSRLATSPRERARVSQKFCSKLHLDKKDIYMIVTFKRRVSYNSTIYLYRE